MASIEPEQETVRHLKRQRDLFAAIAICSLGLIGLAVPRKAENNRELRAVNSHLLALQASIVDTQRQIRVIEDQILGVQREIKKRQAK
jgi:hypothetical protein